MKVKIQVLAVLIIGIVISCRTLKEVKTLSNPLTIKTDIMKVTSHNSVNALVNFGLNLADASNTPTRVTIKIKPSLRIGKKQISYPGFIKVNKEFSSE